MKQIKLSDGYKYDICSRSLEEAKNAAFLSTTRQKLILTKKEHIQIYEEIKKHQNQWREELKLFDLRKVQTLLEAGPGLKVYDIYEYTLFDETAYIDAFEEAMEDEECKAIDWLPSINQFCEDFICAVEIENEEE